MTRYRIGAGGWAYFQVPGVHPLVAYSRAFDFVEANATFYETPPRQRVESWRQFVPSSFEFAVRCNKAVTHTHRFEPNPGAFVVLDTDDHREEHVGIPAIPPRGLNTRRPT